MRRLHPVSDHERVVAQGEYRYFQDGEPTGIGEQWELTRLQNGNRIYRVEVGDGDGLWHLIVGSAGRPDRLQVRLRDEADRRFNATYTFFDDEVLVTGGQVGTKRQEDALDLPPGFALTWVPFAGREPALLGYDPEAGGSQAAMQYYLRQLSPEEGWLSGQTLGCTIERLGSDELEVPAGSFEADEVAITASDLADQRAWFDRHGTLLQWASGGQVQAVLARYRRLEGTE